MNNNIQNPTEPIQTEEQLRDQLRIQGWWVSIPISTFPAHWLSQGDQRLDGGFYANDVFLAQRLVLESSYPSKTLNDLEVTAYHPTESQPRSNFKRIYARDGLGVPYLSASEMYLFQLQSDRQLSRAMEKLDELRVHEGSILMSRSGNVAYPVLVGRTLSKFAITDDALRISSGSLPVGYLYAYLASWIGHSLSIYPRNQLGLEKRGVTR